MNGRRGAGIGWAAVVAAQFACSAGASPARPLGELPLGTWGGDSAGMVVSDSSTHLQIACTYGDVAGRVPLAADGSFSASGSYMLRAYPVPLLPSDPALFRGVTDGSTVTVTVLVDDTAAHQSVTRGPVVLQLGATPHWGPCPL